MIYLTLHSIARNHALIDAAYDLIISVPSGQLDAVDAIAAVLQAATGPRR